MMIILNHFYQKDTGSNCSMKCWMIYLKVIRPKQPKGMLPSLHVIIQISVKELKINHYFNTNNTSRFNMKCMQNFIKWCNNIGWSPVTDAPFLLDQTCLFALIIIVRPQKVALNSSKLRELIPYRIGFTLVSFQVSKK